MAQGHLQLGPRPVVRGRAMEAGNAPGKRWENHRGNIWGKSPYELRFMAGKRSSLKLNGDQWGSVGYFPCLITAVAAIWQSLLLGHSFSRSLAGGIVRYACVVCH